MKLPKTVILATLLTAAGAATGAPGLTSPTDSELEPPSTTDCTRLTNGTILMPGTEGFTPSCIVVDPGDRVTWRNADTLVHDPGDGLPGDEVSECFESTDFTLQNGLESTDTFGGEFHFDTSREQLTLENVTFNGETPPVDDTRDCDDREWTFNEDGDVAFSYICHIHENDGHGWIIIDL